jgi:hypothetical protein
LHDKGSIGVFLKWFLWYNSDPNILEPFVWLIIVMIWRWCMWQPHQPKAVQEI